MRHWEELIDFINKNGGPKEPYSLTLMFKWNLEQNAFDPEKMGLYKSQQMMIDCLYCQVSYNCRLSNAFKLQLGHNVKQFWVEMKRATGKQIARNVIWLAKVIPASHVKVRYAHLPIIIHRLWKVLKRVEERRERRMVGKRMIHELM